MLIICFRFLQHCHGSITNPNITDRTHTHTHTHTLNFAWEMVKTSEHWAAGLAFYEVNKPRFASYFSIWRSGLMSSMGFRQFILNIHSCQEWKHLVHWRLFGHQLANKKEKDKFKPKGSFAACYRLTTDGLLVNQLSYPSKGYVSVKNFISLKVRLFLPS